MARRSLPPSTVAALSPWLGAAAAFWIGTWGLRDILAGRGAITIYAPVGADGWRAVALVSALWLVAATVSRRSPLLVWLWRVAAIAAGVALTASNVGRSIGGAAVLSVMVAHAALVEWRPRSGWPERPRQVAWAALVPLAASQVVWTTQRTAWPTIALLGLGLAAVEAHHRWPAVPERWYLRVAAWIRLGAATMATAGRRGAASVRLRSGWCRGMVRRVRADPVPCIVGAAGALVMLPIAYRYSSTPSDVLAASDFPLHLEKAREIEWIPFRPTAPHPLFHLTVAALLPVVGLAWASTLVISAVGALTAVVLYSVGRGAFAGRGPLSPLVAAAFALGYFIADSPALVAQWLRVGNPRDWAPSLHVYLSPTDTLLVPFAILLVVLTGRSVRDHPGEGAGRGWGLTVVAMATVLAKPSFTIAFLPAIALYLVLAGRMDRSLIVYLAKWLYLPSALVVVAQIWFLEAGVNDVGESGIALEPLATLRMLNLGKGGPLIFAGALIIALAWWAAGRRFLAEPVMALSLTTLLVALVILLLFRETGVRSEHPVFSKPATIVTGVVTVLAWRSGVGDAVAAWSARSERPLPVWFWLGGAFLALTLLGGVLGYLDSAGAISLPVRPTG